MAFQHGVQATLSVAATALAGYLESASMDLQRELAEIRAAGASSVERVAGLKDAKFTAEGAYDAVCDAALFNAWNGATSVALEFSPDNGTTKYTCNVWITSYKVTAGTGGKCTWSIDVSLADGNVGRA